ncbi:MAG: hypothetical protein P9L92_10655 [Candidatus Electryonea clarkiae]|nr:hypothetical protein [Candidatus Electryonea clarkiae]MDP8288555.1 hypothetical protein [Candidatus Electryonea clarkiae]
MNIAAVIFGISTAIVLYGGLAWCLVIAMRTKKDSSDFSDS